MAGVAGLDQQSGNLPLLRRSKEFHLFCFVSHFDVSGKDLTIQGLPSATLDESGSFGSTLFGGASGAPWSRLTLNRLTVTEARTPESSSITGT